MNILKKIPYRVMNKILHEVTEINSNAKFDYNTDEIFSDWIFKNVAIYSEDNCHITFYDYYYPFSLRLTFQYEVLRSVTFVNSIFLHNSLSFKPAVVSVIFDNCVFKSGVTITMNLRFIERVTFRDIIFKDDSLFRNQEWALAPCHIELLFENCILPDDENLWIDLWISSTITVNYKDCEYFE